MALATFSVRMEEDLKKQFDALCLDFGMNATTAFNVFARAVVREGKIPFEIKSSADFSRASGKAVLSALRLEAKNNNVQDMPLVDINAEIRKSRYGDNA